MIRAAPGMPMDCIAVWKEPSAARSAEFHGTRATTTKMDPR